MPGVQGSILAAHEAKADIERLLPACTAHYMEERHVELVALVSGINRDDVRVLLDEFVAIWVAKKEVLHTSFTIIADSTVESVIIFIPIVYQVVNERFNHTLTSQFLPPELLYFIDDVPKSHMLARSNKIIEYLHCVVILAPPLLYTLESILLALPVMEIRQPIAHRS